MTIYLQKAAAAFIAILISVSSMAAITNVPAHASSPSSISAPILA